jgi:hypothetical protein
MSEIRDEPAFPNEWCNELGMSMRDYFAAKAMEGLLSDPTNLWDDIPRLAYDIADGMLIARGEDE